jgi:hypothetical protein
VADISIGIRIKHKTPVKIVTRWFSIIIYTSKFTIEGQKKTTGTFSMAIGIGQRILEVHIPGKPDRYEPGRKKIMEVFYRFPIKHDPTSVFKKGE